MKKILILIFLAIAFTTYSQNPLEPTVRSYFRVNPFTMKFDDFIATLQKDRWLKMETYHPKTDSTFLFLEGTYKYFSPFRFIPEELRFALVEEELVHLDSLHTRDTIINMQLTGITDSGRENMKIVQKEFYRFHNNQSGRFPSYYTYQKIEEKGEIVAEIHNYFIPPSVEPMTIAWGFLRETNQYSFTLTVCFKIKQNKAHIIVTPGEF